MGDKFESLRAAPNFVHSISEEDDLDSFFSAALELVENEEHREAMLSVAALLAQEHGGEVRVNMVVASHEVLNEKLQPPLSGAFAAFDKDGDGWLSGEEANAFFRRYVEVVRKYTTTVTLERKFSGMVPQIVQGAVQQIPWSQFPPEAVAQTEAAAAGSIWKQLEPQVEAVFGQHLALFDAYSANMDDSNTRAFEAVDTNKDGRLCLDEIFAALIPQAPQNMALTAALRLDGRGE